MFLTRSAVCAKNVSKDTMEHMQKAELALVRVNVSKWQNLAFLDTKPKTLKGNMGYETRSSHCCLFTDRVCYVP